MVEVFNAGRPGDNSADLVDRFGRDAAARKPDLVIIWIGSNDMLYPGHTSTLPEFEANMRELLRRIREIGSAAAVCTLPPVIGEFLFEQFPASAEIPLTPQERLAAANRVICSLGVPVIDIAGLVAGRGEALLSEKSFLRNPANSGARDGLHFTPAGCAAAARLARTVISKNGLPHENIVCLGDSLTYGVYLAGKGSAAPGAETYPGQLAALLTALEE